jgi:hypothetical protein
MCTNERIANPFQTILGKRRNWLRRHYQPSVPPKVLEPPGFFSACQGAGRRRVVIGVEINSLA